MKVIYIDNDQTLSEVVEHLSKSEIKEIAVDFEGDFSRFKYGITLCLVQMYDGENGYIIDPFAVNMHLLREIFTGEKTKVMFDPSGDFILLQNSHGIIMRNVLDAQLAAKLLDFQKLSLTAVLNECLGVEIINKKKFQTANWTKRPLEPELLEYAISDVIYLLKVKDLLLPRLVEQGKYDQFMQMNRDYSLKDYTIDKRKKYLKLKNAMRLSKASKIYLKHFYDAREKVAKSKDIPANYVIQNELLLKIAQNPPKTSKEWLALEGIPRNFPRYLKDFIRAKAKADRVIRNFEASKKAASTRAEKVKREENRAPYNEIDKLFPGK